MALNKVILIGRLTKDPELRYTANGTATSKFTLAVDRDFSKEKEKQADFINIVAWKNLAENSSKYLQKGSMAMIEGSIQSRSYENAEKKKVFVTEVVAQNVQFLDKVKKNEINIEEDNEEIPF
jgi:single-strand DNA-binding protein